MKIQIALMSLLIPVTATAHHARVYFSDERLEIEGELVDVKWRNPHPGFTVNVRTPDGQVVAWNLEAFGSLYPLQRAGVTRERFELGQQVKILGQASTRREHELLVSNILLADGTEAILSLEDTAPYWAESTLMVGGDGWAATEADVVEAASENLGIFRVWSPTGTFETSEYSPFTAAAIAGRSTWDPQNNPIMRCEMPGMPFVMKTPHPYQFIDGGDQITLRGETWEMERTIHMVPSDQEPNPLGYSVGRWEGTTLVVHTTRINWPYFDTIGTPQTEEVEMIEKFTLSEDQTRLNYHLTVTDPYTFTEPATYEIFWLALGDELPVYDCQVF